MPSLLKASVRLMMQIAVLVVAIAAPRAHAEDTIKIGVLHSLSGTMAISETSLRDVVLMAVEELNASGGVLGKKLRQPSLTQHRIGRFLLKKAKELIVDEKSFSDLWLLDIGKPEIGFASD